MCILREPRQAAVIQVTGQIAAGTKKAGPGTRSFQFHAAVRQLPGGRPRFEGWEMSIITIRSFSSYQHWKRLMPSTSMS